MKTLELVGEEIKKNAKSRAPVRKAYKEGGVRPRTKAASPALIAATIRSIQNRRGLTDYQRKRYIADIKNSPSEFRVLVNRRGSTNKKQRANPLLLGGYTSKVYKPKKTEIGGVAFLDTNATGVAKTKPGWHSAKGRRINPIYKLEKFTPGTTSYKDNWRTSDRFYKQPQIGFEVKPGSALDQDLTSQARHAIKTGEGLVNEKGEAWLNLSVNSRKSAQVRFGGRLKNSIELGTSTTGKGYSIKVSAPVPYAKYVEFPTRHNAAQPFLLPAMKHGKKFLEAAMEGQARDRGLNPRKSG